MLRVEDLQVRRGRKTVLADVTLDLLPGEVLGVLGPNGAGKSTLLGALCGELHPDQGRVWLGQQALKDWTGSQRAQRLAVLPQSSTLDFAFRVEEVVGMGRLPHQTGRVRDDEIINAALQAADVAHLSGRSYLALSGGERQRVHLARCWRSYGRVKRGRRCCWMSRRRCLIPCISTRHCRPSVPLPIGARPCW